MLYCNGKFKCKENDTLIMVIVGEYITMETPNKKTKLLNMGI